MRKATLKCAFLLIPSTANAFLRSEPMEAKGAISCLLRAHILFQPMFSCKDSYWCHWNHFNKAAHSCWEDNQHISTICCSLRLVHTDYRRDLWSSEATHSPRFGRGLHSFMWKERMVKKRRRGKNRGEWRRGEREQREKTMEGKVEAKQRGERWGEWWRWQIIHVYFNQPGGCTKLVLDVNHLLNPLEIRSESSVWFKVWTWRPHHEVGHLLSCVFPGVENKCRKKSPRHHVTI